MNLRSFACLILASCLSAGGLSAQVSNDLLGMQGRLTDAAGNPVTGSLAFTVSLYSQTSGGTAVWTQILASVEVRNGAYSL